LASYASGAKIMCLQDKTRGKFLGFRISRIWIWICSRRQGASKTRQGMAMEGGPGAPAVNPDPRQPHVVTAGAPPRLPPPCPRGNTTETHSAAYSRKTGKTGGGGRAAGADVMMTATHPSSLRDAPMPLCATTGCRYSCTCRSHSRTERRRRCVSRPLCSANRPPRPSPARSAHT
jgi:hypothetical protein